MPYKDKERERQNKKEYYIKNREKILQYEFLKYRKPEEKIRRKAYLEKYFSRPEIKEKVNQYQKKYRKIYYDQNKPRLKAIHHLW